MWVWYFQGWKRDWVHRLMPYSWRKWNIAPSGSEWMVPGTVNPDD